MTAQFWAEKPHSEWAGEDLLACARWWAEELGLGTWDIRAVFVQRHEIDGAQATCRYNGSYERLSIRVAEWRSYSQDDQPPGDLECSVVHELLHARFWASDVAPGDNVQSHVHETAIERTARALVRQRRIGR